MNSVYVYKEFKALGMKYQLTIPKPCHENWSTMTSTEKGKFCKGCNKEVIDFTNVSTFDISKKVVGKEDVCGRFKTSQLHKEIETNSHSNFTKIAASVALVAAISVSEPILSQAKKDSIEVRNHIKGKFIIKKDSVENFINFKGTVKDNSGSLAIVSVVLKNTNIGTETDFDGNFSIKIPNKKQKSIILVFSYVGYKTQEIDVLKIKQPLVLEMMEDTAALQEVITIGYVSVHRSPNVFRWIGNLFRKKENKR